MNGQLDLISPTNACKQMLWKCVNISFWNVTPLWLPFDFLYSSLRVFSFFWEAGLSIVGPGTWFLPLEHLARLWQYRSSGLYLQIYVIRLPSGGIQEPAFFTSCQECCNLKTSIEDHHYVCDSMEVYTFLKRLLYHMKNTSRDLVIARVTFLPREWASAFSPYSEYYY